ncbi:MAG: hypothetical protein ACR2RV_12555, partial [Verrucomicrobiales bacterium]
GQNLPEKLARFLMGDGHSPHRLYREQLRENLEQALAGLSYRGPIGVDAFVYRDLDGELALRQIAEINPRYTMGRVAHEIRRRIAPEHCARIEFHTRNQLAAQGYSDFDSYLRSDGAGVALNDPKSAKHVLADLKITKTMPPGNDSHRWE